MTTRPEPRTSQVVITPPGGMPTWLGSIGHATGPRYSTVYPGGAKQMTCSLAAPAEYRAGILTLGSQVRIFRGGTKIWDGTLDEPSPGDIWSLSAVGSGVQGNDFKALYTSTWPTNQPDEPVNNAISRGLPWTNPGVGQPTGIWLGQAQDSGQPSISELLNLLCTRGGLAWFVNSQPGGLLPGPSLSISALPTTVTRILVCNSPVPRTNGGDVRAIHVRYQVTADNVAGSTAATYALTTVTNTGHGGREQTLDLSNAGVMTLAAAQAVAAKVLQIYQRSSFTGPFTVSHGDLLTTGGVPVDLGCEQAGFVARMILADYAFGGEMSPLSPPQFICGEYEYDDEACTATITPYQTLPTRLADLLSGASAGTL